MTISKDMSNLLNSFNPSDEKGASKALSDINEAVQALLDKAEEISEKHKLHFSSGYHSYIGGTPRFYKKTDKEYGNQDWISSTMVCAADGDEWEDSY